MGIAESAWLLLGTPFRVSGLPPGPLSDLTSLLRGFPAAPADLSEAGVVEIRAEGGGTEPWAVVDDEGVRWEVPPDGAPLSSHVEYRMVDAAIRRARDRWVLHAGAVVAGGGTCLVVGESGAGKTSLTLWLWTSGLPLVTDDLCPLDRATFRPEVFPRALHMDAEYSPRLLERLPPKPPGFPVDYYPFPGSPEPAETVPAIDRLLVLERGAGPEGPEGSKGKIEPLAQAEAVHHLLGAVIKGPGFDYGAALGAMVSVASRCRAYRLRSSTPEAAGERALEILSSPSSAS